MIIRLILIALIATTKALVDTIAFHHGGVFKSIDFFNINIQGHFLPFTTYPFDGFHLANSFMIFLLIICALPIFKPSKLKWYWEFVIYSAAFILIFNLFWTHIFN